MSAGTVTVYRNGRVFTGPGATASTLVVDGESIAHVGDDVPAAYADAEVVDLDGAALLPGFVDAHTHLIGLGTSLQQVDLLPATDLADLQRRIAAAAAADPEAPRIVGRSWLFGPLEGRTPTRHLLDEVVPDRPVYLISNDVHSGWVNTAALRELGIDDETPDPIGGSIARDTDGVATGMLYETAALGLMRDFLEGTETDESIDAALDAAFRHYRAAGVTAAIDMGLGELEVPAFERALRRHGGRLPIRVAGHWLVTRTDSVEGNLEQVRRAAELRDRLTGPWLRVNGIKIMVDGVIDSCTAAMKRPFADGSHPGPIWDLDALVPVVTAADAAGLQIALHAIGDEASDVALSALEQAVTANGPRERRHRIEHLETVTEENVARLADLGVIASMQPVHADPLIQDAWRAMLGDDRVERGFPWPEFTRAGARLAFGTDAPTAPYAPLPNMYVATTRRSAVAPDLPANLPEYALGLGEALAHATADAAYSGGWEAITGTLRPGLAADLVVLDRGLFAGAPEEMLEARVVMSLVSGQRGSAASSLSSR
ncbi:amidohydrolase [Nocardioides luteus]|uniref:Amidohydrolase n=1 Tax=Nocardioides luteus TaxID=1844 RepID=A0A1J4NAJ2_9ACTN|nr:amidohydrolase [Nocardioides luteus]OIJ28531.1 amidohydrolase [Nocardioides luteus]